MILTDTGPLVGLLDRNDPYHEICKKAASDLPSGFMLTTWPCLTEAMYLLGRAGGPAAQSSLWKLVNEGLLLIWDAPSAGSLRRMSELMEKYRDLPMDLADASLIVAAEVTGNRRLFSLDGDFRVYRCADGTAIEVVP